MSMLPSTGHGGAARLLLIVLVVATLPVLGLFLLLRSVTQVPSTGAVEDPAGVLLDAEEVSLTASDGVTLSAWLIRGRPDAPPIILAHDLGGAKSDLLNAAVVLNRSGYNLLLLDLRRHGASGGTLTTLGARESLDVLAAAAWLEKRFGARARRIGGWGVGMGAYALALASTEAPALDVLALDGLYPDVAVEAGRRLSGRLPPPLRLLVPVAALLYDPFFRCRLEDHALRRRAAGLAGKDLLIIAPSESPERLEEARRIYESVPEASEGGRSLLVLRRSGLSGLYADDRARYDDAIREFFAGALPPAGAGSSEAGVIEVIEQ